MKDTAQRKTGEIGKFFDHEGGKPGNPQASKDASLKINYDGINGVPASGNVTSSDMSSLDSNYCKK